MDELRSMPPVVAFTVERPIACLFTNAVEHASSYGLGWEPRFDSMSPTVGKTAWMRQPLTLVQFEAKSPTSTEVRLTQTAGARTMGQGADLMQYLRRAPPCPA